MPSALGDGFGDDALLNTIDEFSSEGDDAGQPDSIRFLRSVSKLVRRRAMRKDAQPGPIAVFLLCPEVPTAPPNRAYERQPMLNRRSKTVEGYLWLVGPMASSGMGIALGGATDDEVFRLVTDEFSLGDVRAIVYDPQTIPFEVRYYPEGLGFPDNCELRTAAYRDVPVNEVLEVVEHVHATNLVTPGAQGRLLKLWESPSKYYVKRDAEERVQTYLKTALGAAFPTCRVLTEQSGVAGRSDLEIEEKDSSETGKFVRHALLELKILRTYGSGGASVSEREIRDWISEGLRQACKYRDERGTRASALCCFDMRMQSNGIVCFAHIATKAKGESVTLRVWPIYNSAAAYRVATG